MIGAYLLAAGLILLSIGVVLLVWDWCFDSNPDAPNGGPVLGFALLLLVFGGITSCAETAVAVKQMQKAERMQPK